jgi:hypothetical protein
LNPGKRFERKFRESLGLLPGWHMRIIDGGDRLHETMPADFWYFPKGGGAVMVECKAVRGKSLPASRVTQLDELVRFSRNSGTCRAIVAANFYGEDVRKDNRCLLMEAETFAALLGGKRKSVPLRAFEALGVEAPKIKGNIWDLSALESAGPFFEKETA